MDRASVTVIVGQCSEWEICVNKKEAMWPGCDKGGTTVKADAASHSQQETLADIEHISTIAGSLGSIGTISQGPDGDPVYETDHTDLNSEYDEVELRKELMKDVSTVTCVFVLFLFMFYISFYTLLYKLLAY